MKVAWASKTLWANLIAIALYVLKYFGFEAVPTVDPLALAIINILLRFLTHQAVTVIRGV